MPSQAQELEKGLDPMVLPFGQRPAVYLFKLQSPCDSEAFLRAWDR